MRRAAIAAVAVAVCLVCAPASSARRDLGAAAPPLRLVPKGETLSVHGLHDYFGTLEIGSASDGLTVSDHLSLERYLLGLNEVPTFWPTEALRAQAVAARTYALWTLAEPRGGSAAVYGFDICATVECQVFSGADVVGLETGDRWLAAVVDTAGTAILYDGRPILARYHSTSGGVTFDNSIAFPGEPDYPYLQGVESTTETASPLYRWRVYFDLRSLTKMLRHAGAFSSQVLGVRTVAPRDGGPYPDVVVVGPARRVRMTADEFRSAVRESAPALYPDRYPSAWHTTSGRLPETLPSERISIHTRGTRVIVRGRGWGHGTGMSQWGAYGLARQGATFDQILLHYYTGVSLGRIDTELPIEVGVATARSSVKVTGEFSIVDGEGRTIVSDALGTWRFVDAGGAIGIDPPRGFGLPLEVGIVDAPKKVDVGEPAFLTIALSRPAHVRAETVGVPERNPKTRVKAAGKRRITWLAPLEEGRYEVRVRAATASARRFSRAVTIEVERPPLVDLGTDVRDGDRPGGIEPALVIALAALVLSVLVIAGVYLSKRPG